MSGILANIRLLITLDAFLAAELIMTTVIAVNCRCAAPSQEICNNRKTKTVEHLLKIDKLTHISKDIVRNVCKSVC